jgi:hypothetical protein
MPRSQPIAAVVALIAAGAGCSRDSAPISAAQERRTEPAREAETRLVAGCRVTLPGGDVPAVDFNYGNGALGAAIWPEGTLVAGELPDGSAWAEIEPDGSITAKIGWFRADGGRLTVQGERLDAAAPPLRADVPDGYGASGFQPTLLTFPTVGCWKVTGSAGGASLTFVVRVTKRRSA